MTLHTLTTMPTLARLSLCLLTSAALHGGVAVYDRVNQPAAGYDSRAAVVVALVDAASEPASAAAAAQPFPEAAAVTASDPLASAAPPVAMPRPLLRQAPPAGRSATVDGEQSEKVIATDPVCAEPRRDVPSKPVTSATPADVGPTTGEIAAPERHGSAGLPAQKVAAVPPRSGDDVVGESATPAGGDATEAMPDYRTNPLPEYPHIARRREWQGVVWLLVDVSAQGRVDHVDVERSCGYRVLDKSARRTVQDWQFTPATRGGLPVESRVRIPVRFSLEDS